MIECLPAALRMLSCPDLPLPYCLEHVWNSVFWLHIPGNNRIQRHVKWVSATDFVKKNSVRRFSSQRPQTSSTGMSLESAIENLHNHVKIFKFGGEKLILWYFVDGYLIANHPRPDLRILSKSCQSILLSVVTPLHPFSAFPMINVLALPTPGWAPEGAPERA